MKFVIFIAIALLITFPWLIHSGYLLLLDWPGVPTPSLSLDPTGGISGLPIQFAWVGLGKLIGSAFAQKILILAMLSVAGSTTYVLTRYITSNTIASVSAGIFAMTNAFVFNRLQMGHIYLLCGYALTPYALYLTMRFVQNPSTKRALSASATSSAVILLSIHHIILLPILAALVIWNFWNKKQYSIFQWGVFLGPYIATTLVLLLIVHNNPLSPLNTLSSKDLSVFAPQMQCTKSLPLDTVLLTAQWRNPHATHIPCSYIRIFTLTSITILTLVFIGTWNNKKLVFGAFILICLAEIPLIPAMRDSAKYIADLAILESILIAYGISFVTTRSARMGIPIASLCVIALAGAPMLWGLSGTITPNDYPSSWYAWNMQLASLPAKPRVLFLPWHLYMPFDFTNQMTIANPTQAFFTNADVIQGDNLEMQQGDIFIATESHSQTSQEITKTLAQINSPNFSNNFQNLLNQQRISYIALAHGSPEEADYQNLLTSLPYLHKILSSSELTVWQFGE